MSVYKDNATGKWRVIYRYTDITGKRKQTQKRGFETKREAVAWEHEMMLKSQAKLDMTFGSFYEIYEADKASRLKRSTWETKSHIIRTKILPYFADRKIDEIEVRDVIAWQNELLAAFKDEGKEEKYSQDYLRTIQAQLTAIFAHAVKYYNLSKNPWNESNILSEYYPEINVKAMKSSDIAKNRKTFLEKDEVKDAYIREMTGTLSALCFYNAQSNYDVLSGGQTDLFKCFLPLAWRILNGSGIGGYVHPEGVYEEQNAGILREAIYKKLVYHFQFQNEKDIFPIAHSKTFSVNVFSNAKASIDFLNINNLYGILSRIGRTLEKSGCSVLEFNFDKAISGIMERVANEVGRLQSADAETFKRIVLGVLYQMKINGAFDYYAFEQFIQNGANYYHLSNDRKKWLPGVNRGLNVPKFVAINRGSKKTKGFDSIDSKSWYAKWVDKYLPEFSLESDSTDIMKIILEELTKAGVLKKKETPDNVHVWAIDTEKCHITRNVKQMVCDECGAQISMSEKDAEIFEGACCTRHNCNGHMYIADEKNLDFYGKLYSQGELVRIVAKEHTGLLERDDREDLERKFKKSKDNQKPWDPNLLSCTPTLEMGIDIGDLSTVILSSIPPAQANYAQRAGRGGRKDGNALTVAIANSRPHTNVITYKEGSLPHNHFRVDNFDISDITHFRKSKMGVMEQFLRDVNDNLSKYMSIDIVEREDAQEFDISNLEKKGISDLEYGEMLQKKGVVIVDENNSEISKDIVAKLQEELEKYYHVKAAVGNLSEEAYNIRIIHDGEYYAENEMHDPHSDNLKGYIVQHITEEAEHFTNTKGSSPDIKKIVQELIIKGDVRERMISIFDWERLDSGKDWTFVLRKKIKTKYGENAAHINHVNKKALNYFQYYRLKIDCNGEMEFDTFCDSNQDEAEEWNKICYAYDFVEDKHRGAQNQIEGLMYSDIDNIHVILLTREKTLPNISALMNTLMETDAKERVSKELLLEAIDDFEKDNIDSRECISEWKNKVAAETEMITKKALKKILNMRTGIASKFNRFLHEKYGVWIDGELRKGEFEATYQIGNLLNIKYEYNEKDYLDGRAFVYYVGAKSKKLTYPNACCMRKVISLGEELEYEEALPLMAVEFVRNSQYTVLPFPFKYLREYIAQC